MNAARNETTRRPKYGVTPTGIAKHLVRDDGWSMCNKIDPQRLSPAPALEYYPTCTDCERVAESGWEAPA